MSKEIKYSKEFKLDALNLLQEGKSISEISKSLGISINTLLELQLFSGQFKVNSC